MGSATLTEPQRELSSFGGLVPAGAVARSGETLVCALALEHHTEGLAVPFLVLSGAPGTIEWEPESALFVHDDRSRRYEARAISVQPALGGLAGTVWLEPAVPPDARRLEFVIDALVRVTPARGGRTVRRFLEGRPWNLLIDLLPGRTAVDLPPAPKGIRSDRMSSVPTRAFAAFHGLIPVGQARIAADAALAVYAIERYSGRAVVSAAVLVAPGQPHALERLGFEAWDDCGTGYRVGRLHERAGPGWAEVMFELVPGIEPRVRRLCLAAQLGRQLQFGIAVPPVAA